MGLIDNVDKIPVNAGLLKILPKAGDGFPPGRRQNPQADDPVNEEMRVPGCPHNQSLIGYFILQGQGL